MNKHPETVALDSIFDRTKHFDNEPEWLAFRRSHFTSSDAAKLFSDPMGLYAAKTGAATNGQPTEQMLFGLDMEVPLSNFLAREGFTVADMGQWAITTSPKPLDWQAATVDRVLTCDGRDTAGLGELKTHALFLRHDFDLGLPQAWQIQVQHQLAVTGLDWAVVCWWARGGDLPQWKFVERHDRFIDALTAAEEKFLERVEAKVPPPLSDPDKDAEALRLLYPKEKEGKAVELPPEAVSLVESWQTLSKRAKLAKDAEAGVKNELILMLADAEIGNLPGGGALTYKSQTVKEHTVPETTFRVLRRKK